MDHLPQQDQPAIRVAFEAPPRIYKPEEFFTLPKTFNCTVTDLMQCGPRILPEEQAPGFLQSWLFFSLLAQVLNAEIDASQFLQQRHGKLEVNTEDLVSLFCQTAPRRVSRVLPHLLDDGERYHSVRASLALDEARNFVLTWCSDNDHERDFMTMETPTPGSWPHLGHEIFRSSFPEMCLSFAILGETLDRYRRRFRPLASIENAPYSSWQDRVGDQRSWGFSDLLRRRMQRIGWCPHEIRRINMTAGDLSSLYFLSSFLPTQQVDHSDCNIQKCLASSVFTAAHHVHNCPNEGTTAMDMSPDEEELIAIVQSGNIPLLRYTNTEELLLTEYVISNDFANVATDNTTEAENQPRFVAISHAWSDGLGPSDGFGLPRCQLVRLRDTMRKHADTKDLPFWIDSLCVPKLVEVKNKAIQNMGQVYKRAFTVLVLDSNLRSTSSLPDTLEATVRINTGIWSKRMWTLPEGVVARNLHFDLKDGLLSAGELRRRYERAKENPTDREHHVYKAGWLFSPYMFSMRHKVDNTAISPKDERVENQQVAHVWQAMQWREATRIEDETLCLARLLDLDPMSILMANGSTRANLKSQRMVEFLKLLDMHIGIPSGMIFLPGPKLNMEGLGFAPSSWMRKQSRVFADPLYVRDQRLSFLTMNGLHVQYPGIQLHPGREPLESRFWIPTARNLTKWYRVEYIPGGSSIRSWEKTWELASRGGQLPAIIRSRFDEDSTEPEIALLVKMAACREEDRYLHGPASRPRANVRWVRSLCRVWIQWETDHAIAAKLNEEFRYNIDKMTWGDSLEPDQRWVVDGYCWDNVEN